MSKENILKQFNNCANTVKTKKFIRVEVPVKVKDLDLLWLSCQNFNTKIYWKSRNSDNFVIGLGIALDLRTSQECVYNEIELLLKDAPNDMKFYGGACFNSDNIIDENWSTFGYSRFILPKIEIYHNKIIFNFLSNENINIDEEIRKSIDQLNFTDKPLIKKANITQKTYCPNKENFLTAIEDTINNICNTDLEKVVLARQCILKCENNINPYFVLNNILCKQHFNFAFSFENDITFIGSSPELLFKKELQIIYSEALAGTTHRGKNIQEDISNAKKLLDSSKEIKEHNFVSFFVYDKLNKLCDDITTTSKNNIIKLQDIQHILTQFKGKLKEKQSVCEIIKTLHPTPAVLGTPSNMALDTINKIEENGRGWYAGPVGWIGKNSAEFAIAIRSAIVSQKTMYLYSGVGLVKESNPKDEWNELNLKINKYLKSF